MIENNTPLYYKGRARIAHLNQGTLQKQFGSMADCIAIVTNLKLGMNWETACYPPPDEVARTKGAIALTMPIDQSWLVANRPLLEGWVTTGIPTHKDRTMMEPRVRYLHIVATPDGRVWGVQQNGTRVLIPEAEAKQVEAVKVQEVEEVVEVEESVAVEDKPKKKKEW